MTAAITITLLIAALLAALVALRYWMASPARVLAEIDALTDVPEHIKTDLIVCIDAAEEADRKTWLYDLSAPLVMLLVLPFALLRNYGFKLDNARYRADGKASAVAIGRSLKRRGD